MDIIRQIDNKYVVRCIRLPFVWMQGGVMWLMIYPNTANLS